MYDILYQEHIDILKYNTSVLLDYYYESRVIVFYLLSYTLIYFWYFLIFSLFVLSIVYFVYLVRGFVYAEIKI